MDQEANIEAPDAIEANGDIRLTQIQWVGLGGALATVAGIFMPLYGLMTFRITMASFGWPAVVIGIAAVWAAFAIIRRSGVLSLIAGLVALGVSLYLLIRTELDRASLNDRFTSGHSGHSWTNPFAHGLSDMTNVVIAPQWGWAVLLVGIAAILLSSFGMLRSSPRHADR